MQLVRVRATVVVAIGVATGVALSSILVGVATAATLTQPNGAAIPSQLGCNSNQPTGLAAEFACECTNSGSACNIGPSCPSPGPCTVPTGTCETTLYHSVNDNTCIPSNLAGLDPWHDGELTPETYTPTCALTFEVVSRGTARFKNIFGWYNVTSSGQPPAPSELVPMIDCNAAPGTAVVLDVRNDSRWAGGEIGFFLATPEDHNASGQCAGNDCCARIDRLPAAGHVFFSQRALNPDAVGAQSIIHLVVYDSAITERKFYFAWEDTLGAANNDFTDLVTSVLGVECAGGGTACNTGMPGMCQYGVTRCSGASIECGQVFGATGESCDGADNDCDGNTDEGLGCENLVGECQNVTCPAGLICKQGQCIDACINVACGTGETCLSGACVPGCNQCNGAVCATGSTCDLQTGDCSHVAGDGDAGPNNGNGDGGTDDDGSPATGGCCDSAHRDDGRAATLFSVALLAAIGRRRSKQRRRA